MKMEEKYKCSWCGCEEVVYGVQTDRGKVRPAKKITLDEGQALIHVICKSVSYTHLDVYKRQVQIEQQNPTNSRNIYSK